MLAEKGARVLVLEARPALGGRATAFTDPATGERVDNGQHVLLGCYRDTFRFLERIGATDHVQVQDRLTVDMVDRDGRASRLACPSLPPPFNLLGGIDDVECARLARSDRGAADSRNAFAADFGEARGSAPRRGNRPRMARSQPPNTAIDRDAMGAAGCRGAQPVDRRRIGGPFARVLAEMLGNNRRDASLALPLKPLDEMYALPARAYIEMHGGEVRTSSPVKIQFMDTRGASLYGSPGRPQGRPHR